MSGGWAAQPQPEFQLLGNQDFIKSKFCRAGIWPALGQPRRLSTPN